MATKPAITKPEVKKSVTAKSKLKKPAVTMAQAPPAPKTSEASRSKKHVFNAETAQVLRDAEAGKNLIQYASLEEMFEDLGI